MMTTDNKPMSDERLTEIQRRIDPNYDRSMLNTYAIEARNDRIALFAEVDRLRAENAAVREIVRAMADYATLKRYMDSCEWCGYIGQNSTAHAPDCPVAKARVLLDAEASNGK